jgi:hypothetical protein
MNRILTAHPEGRPNSPCFHVGRDSSGNWVAQDVERRCYALFAGRAQALRFAMFEDGSHPRAAIMVPGVLELDLGGARAPTDRAGADDRPLRRRPRRGSPD